MYINHRPAFGLDPMKLIKAFETLGLPTDKGNAIDRGDLLDLLQTKGMCLYIFHFWLIGCFLVIRKTSPCNVYPLELLFSKTGVCRGIPIFLIFTPKHRLWVLVRTA